jgi:hypothetical protein
MSQESKKHFYDSLPRKRSAVGVLLFDDGKSSFDCSLSGLKSQSLASPFTIAWMIAGVSKRSEK